MKKLIYILPLFIFATACSNRAVKDKLVMIDSLAVQERYDSAYSVLSEIDTTLLTDQDTKAYYYLLRKHLGYLTPHRDSTNMLDSIVIPYYTSTDNKEKLADAYYYKAYGKAIKGNMADATKEIQKKYGRLTTRNMLYLILVDMGKSNDEICKIMSIDKSSLRSLTFRLRKQIKDSNYNK